MKKLLACLIAVWCFVGSISAIAVSAEEFTEPNFYIVARNNTSITYFMHYYNADGADYRKTTPYNTSFIQLGKNPDTDYQYGDILLIDAGYTIDSSYPGSYYVSASPKEARYVGNCKDLLETKELILTKKEKKEDFLVYDPEYYEQHKELFAEELFAGYITFFFEDDAGKEYQYTDEYYSLKKEIDLNLYDIGDTVTFSVYHDTLILPLKEELLQLEIMKGDVSGDDEVNVLDVIEINRAVLGKSVLSEEQTQAADVDGNGIIDAADSLLILKYLVGIVEAL